MRFILSLLLFVMMLTGCAGDVAPAENTLTPPEDRKRIALSYDDAPRGDGRVFSGPERTQAIIQQLEDSEAGPAAMFITTRGVNTPEGRARVQAYADAGHLIANHTHTHPWASRTDIEDYLADIDQAEDLLAGLPNRRNWFRFPFLDEGGYGELPDALTKRDTLRAGLSDRGLINGYVTVDTFDWHLERLWQQALADDKIVNETALGQLYIDMVLDAANHYDRMSMDVLGRRPAHVLLLHENDLAGRFTAQMVQALRDDGWEIIDPDLAYADPIAIQIPDTRFAGMGRIAALAADKGRSGPDYFDHWSASEAGIDERAAERQIFESRP